MKTRMIRINDEIARVVANTIRSEMSDPRLGTVVSVVKSETTSDLKHSKIFVSIIGDEQEREAAMAALTKAAGFIRKQVASTIDLRQTPEIKFEYCDSIEHGMRMRKLIEEVNSSGSDS